MKKLFLWGILVSLSGWIPAQAQAQKGTTYWGGTVGFNGQIGRSHPFGFDSKQNYGSHAIAPEVQWGKFANPTTVWGLGSRYNLSWSSNKFTNSQTNSSYKGRFQRQSLAVLPFVRKYKFLGERWAVFLHTELGPTYTWEKAKNTGGVEPTRKMDYWRYSLSVYPGLVYFFPGKKISLEGYANILYLETAFTPLRSEIDQPRQFSFTTGFSTDFPGYFTLRLTKNISSKTTEP